MSAETQTKFELKGPHVLVMILAFFAAIIAVDVAFGVIAIRTFPGEDEKHSYIQGLHYNQTLERRQAERALGWRATARFESSDATIAIIVEIKDDSGAPVAGVLQGALRRPVDANGDRALNFVTLGPGLYRAEAPGLAAGAWDLRTEAISANQHFSIERRLTWRPST